MSVPTHLIGRKVWRNRVSRLQLDRAYGSTLSIVRGPDTNFPMISPARKIAFAVLGRRKKAGSPRIFCSRTPHH